MKVDLDYFKDNFFGYSKMSFPVSFLENKKLRSCAVCEGTGRISNEELTDYHKREYNTFYSDCEVCNGQGRVIITEIFVSLGDIPYKTGRPTDLHNILFETLREPYTKEGAKGVEDSSSRKVFYFGVDSIREK